MKTENVFDPSPESKANQRTTILQLLKIAPLTTRAARAAGIMHPAGRVKELRDMGCQIETFKCGRQARYVLKEVKHAR